MLVRTPLGCALLGATPILLLVAGGALAEPFNFDHTPGRLPKNVVPLDYTVELRPDAKALTLAGRESIVLEVRTATDTIQFDSANEVLSDVRFDGKPVKASATDDAHQLTTVSLAHAAGAGRHTLSFAYTGHLEQSARGLFVQPYRKADGTNELMLSTQFEAIDARRMFPCWDEPSFRATFHLSVTLREDWTAVSNMPVERRTRHAGMATTTFRRTPKMASYLLELSAGDLASIDQDVHGKHLGLWAIRGQEGQGDWALGNIRDILTDYSDYFAYPFPLPKLDSIAIPGGWSGAMENWGAITYMDRLLLVTPQTSLGTRQAAFTVQAHEMAHQWFGDLVTMAWWDEEWLNESMTFWMEKKETALRHPEWHWPEQQDGEKEAAMRIDAQANAEAIHVHVTDELQASASYDQDVVGGKGQTVMRMFENYLGPDVFRAGLREYMQARAYSNATAADLWLALGHASGQDIAALIGPWAEQPGFPLVTVAAQCAPDGARTLALSQQRFLLTGEDSAHLGWSIPLELRSGAQGAAQPLLLTPQGAHVAAGRCDEPLSVNAGGYGYYRASYDAGTLAANTRALATLPDADRIVLLDDQWALARSGAAPLSSYLALAERLGTTLNTRAWTQVAGALDSIEHAERGTPGYAAFKGYARKLLEAPFARLQWDRKPGEGPDTQALRQTVIADLGAWGDEAVIAEARRRYERLRADPGGTSPDEQRSILAVVAHHADEATFEQLHALAKATSNPELKQRYLLALTLVDEERLAARAAAIIVSDDVPPQAPALRNWMLSSLASGHPRLAWNTMTAHRAMVWQAYGGLADSILVQYAPQLYGADIPLDEFEGWLRTNLPKELSPAIDRGLQEARQIRAEHAMLVSAMDAYLH